MNKKLFVLTASVLVLALAFAGCGQAEKDVENTVSKIEQEAGKIVAEDKSAIESFLATIEGDVQKIEEAVEMDGKATLKILKEDEKTIKYQFTVAEEAVSTEVSELEAKATGLEQNIQEHLKSLKETGIADVKAVVQFVDKEGNELYSKIFPAA